MIIRVSRAGAFEYPNIFEKYYFTKLDYYQSFYHMTNVIEHTGYTLYNQLALMFFFITSPNASLALNCVNRTSH